LKLITVDDTVKTNVLGFRDNSFCDIQQYVSNDQAYDNLLGKKDCYEMFTFVEFPCSNTDKN
jgi:hypothetical protein